MEDHEHRFEPWKPTCEIACERQDLVASVLGLVRQTRVIVIRATPQSGKSTLLKLLGRHILYNERDLEPVFIDWRPEDDRNGTSYDMVLDREKSRWQQDNQKYRPHNPNAKTIYLIDEAQKSSEEVDFWKEHLTKRNTRSMPLFVLVCLYSVDSISRHLEAGIESQARHIDSLQRVELFPAMSGNPYMPFTLSESNNAIQKWAIFNKFTLEDGVVEYLHSVTNGHAGVLALVLEYFEGPRSQTGAVIQSNQTWLPKQCHLALVSLDGLSSIIARKGRGYWTVQSERKVRKVLSGRHWCHIPYGNVVKALREVASSPRGHTHPPGNDALEFCHIMGYLYTETPLNDNGSTTYFFASQIHRRIAYRRLLPGPEPHDDFESRTLRDVCFKAIERFSPFNFSVRLSQYHGKRALPEVAFSDEMLCCLDGELCNLPVFSQYTHDSEGGIDFFFFGRKWGIDILQCGTRGQIREHAARFAPGGRYQIWNILEGYIVINFCSRSALRKVEVEDVKISSRIFQVVIDLDQCVAEVREKRGSRAIYGRNLSQRTQVGSCKGRSERDQELKEEKEELAKMRQEREECERRMQLEIDRLRLQLGYFK